MRTEIRFSRDGKLRLAEIEPGSYFTTPPRMFIYMRTEKGFVSVGNGGEYTVVDLGSPNIPLTPLKPVAFENDTLIFEEA